MSKVTFQAIFKQIYGEPPYAHIKNYKMNLAAVYLQETDQSITQIAGELGYSNISKFAKGFFKKCFLVLAFKIKLLVLYPNGTIFFLVSSKYKTFVTWMNVFFF